MYFQSTIENAEKISYIKQSFWPLVLFKVTVNTHILMQTHINTNTMDGSTRELTARARYTPDWVFRGVTEVRRGLGVVRGNRAGRMVASKKSVYVSAVSEG